MGEPEKGDWESNAHFRAVQITAGQIETTLFPLPFRPHTSHRNYASGQNIDNTGSTSVQRWESLDIVPLTAVSFHNLGKIFAQRRLSLWHIFGGILCKLILALLTAENNTAGPYT